MLSRFMAVIAVAVFCGSVANSKVNSKCIKKGNKTFCTPAEKDSVKRCSFEFGQKRRVLTRTEIQKCLIKVSLYCTKRVKIGQSPSVIFTMKRAGFMNSGNLEPGLFIVGPNSRVYKASGTPSINACVKAMITAPAMLTIRTNSQAT